MSAKILKDFSFSFQETTQCFRKLGISLKAAEYPKMLTHDGRRNLFEEKISKKFDSLSNQELIQKISHLTELKSQNVQCAVTLIFIPKIVKESLGMGYDQGVRNAPLNNALKSIGGEALDDLVFTQKYDQTIQKLSEEGLRKKTKEILFHSKGHASTNFYENSV